MSPDPSDEAFSFEPNPPKPSKKTKSQPSRHTGSSLLRLSPPPRWEPPAMAPGVTLAKLMSGR